jgi:hypothetical protein
LNDCSEPDSFLSRVLPDDLTDDLNDAAEPTDDAPLEGGEEEEPLEEPLSGLLLSVNACTVVE